MHELSDKTTNELLKAGPNGHAILLDELDAALVEDENVAGDWMVYALEGVEQGDSSMIAAVQGVLRRYRETGERQAVPA